MFYINQNRKKPVRKKLSPEKIYRLNIVTCWLTLDWESKSHLNQTRMEAKEKILRRHSPYRWGGTFNWGAGASALRWSLLHLVAVGSIKIKPRIVDNHETSIVAHSSNVETRIEEPPLHHLLGMIGRIIKEVYSRLGYSAIEKIGTDDLWDWHLILKKIPSTTNSVIGICRLGNMREEWYLLCSRNSGYTVGGLPGFYSHHQDKELWEIPESRQELHSWRQESAVELLLWNREAVTCWLQSDNRRHWLAGAMKKPCAWLD